MIIRSHEPVLHGIQEFCQGQLFNKDGTRSVCIKFMRHRSQFELEIAARSRLDLASGSNWFIAPILEDFDDDRITKKRNRESTLRPPRTTPEGEYNDYAVPIKGYDTGSVSTDNRGMDSKDELFALHSIERNASISSFSLFRYAIVLPGGDRDLDAISQHEQLKIGQIRRYTLQVASALEHLHENSECKIHFFAEYVGLPVSTFACVFGYIYLTLVIRLVVSSYRPTNPWRSKAGKRRPIRRQDHSGRLGQFLFHRCA